MGVSTAISLPDIDETHMCTFESSQLEVLKVGDLPYCNFWRFTAMPVDFLRKPLLSLVQGHIESSDWVENTIHALI